MQPIRLLRFLLLLEYLLNKCGAVEMCDVNERKEEGDFGVNPGTTYVELYLPQCLAWSYYERRGVGCEVALVRQ